MFVAPLYAGVLGLLYVALTFQVVKLRRENKVAYGDGGNKLLARVIRGHANFAEASCLPGAVSRARREGCLDA